MARRDSGKLFDSKKSRRLNFESRAVPTTLSPLLSVSMFRPGPRDGIALNAQMNRQVISVRKRLVVHGSTMDGRVTPGG